MNQRATLPGAALLLALSLPLLGCEVLFDIEAERALDTAILDSRGYAGCVPGDDCSFCTSRFHECVCLGWYGETEDRERRDLQWSCAGEFAPPSGVDLKSLQQDYDEFRADEDAGE